MIYVAIFYQYNKGGAVCSDLYFSRFSSVIAPILKYITRHRPGRGYTEDSVTSGIFTHPFNTYPRKSQFIINMKL